MHTVLKHQKRSGDRYDWLWQLATDYTINSMLVKNGLTLPDRVNYQDRFEGMYAEEVYEILRSEIINEELSGDENLKEQAHNEQGKDNNDRVSEEGRGTEESEERPRQTAHSDAVDNEGSPETPTENREDEEPEMDLEAEEQMAREFYEQLFEKMNRQGTLPKDLKLLVPEYFSHKVDWRERLYRYIADHAKSSFAFVPPNMKYLYRGIYLPSLSSDLLRIVIAIDTSGSIDEGVLATFLGEVQSSV